MVDEYDAIVVGGGHNGLTCGCYLAKAGLRVLVLERRHVVGGGVITEELTVPGFKHNVASNYHGWLHFGPVWKDLELEKYGSKYIFPKIAFGMAFLDDTGFVAYKYMSGIIEQLSRFSEHDAKAFLQLREEFSKFKHILKGFLFSAPANPSALPALLQSSREGRELIRFSLSNAKTIINERFENDRIKAWMLLTITYAGIAHDIYGTGLFVPVMSVMEGGWGLSVGGSGMLTQAMSHFIEDHGGKVMTNSQVDKIVLENGLAREVQLSDGSRFRAKKLVASNVEPGQTFLKMVGAERLPEHVVTQVKRWRAAEMSIMSIHLALNEPLRWKAADFCPDLNKCWGVSVGYENPEVFDSQFADIRQGIPPREVGGLFVTPTLYDPSQAPEGKHTGLLWQYTCYDLKGGAARWDEIKEEYADQCVAGLRRYVHNLTDDNIIARRVMSPLDIERYNISMIKGDLSAGELSQDQMGIFRPVHGYGPYRTPIKNLYLCGPSTHPGGNVSGASGYNAVNAIADDLGIKKWWIR